VRHCYHLCEEVAFKMPHMGNNNTQTIELDIQHCRGRKIDTRLSASDVPDKNHKVVMPAAEFVLS
jgi:hypothetical protein